MKVFFLLLIFFLSLFSHPGYFEPWGKDSDLIQRKTQKKEKSSSSIFTLAADKVIQFHQKVLSPVDGPRSHFRPTSSRYMQLAMQKYGFLRGYVMGCDRLLRENDEPWVYRTVTIDGKTYKYDPADVNKF